MILTCRSNLPWMRPSLVALVVEFVSKFGVFVDLKRSLKNLLQSFKPDAILSQLEMYDTRVATHLRPLQSLPLCCNIPKAESFAKRCVSLENLEQLSYGRRLFKATDNRTR